MSDEIPIVNEQDEIIGYRNRTNLKEGDMYRVSMVWITDSKQRILLAQRSKIKALSPLCWGPAAAGTLERGETYEQNIVKEAMEELGIIGIKFTKGVKFKQQSTRSYFVQTFFATLDRAEKDFRIQKEEVEQVKWFTRSELRKEFSANPKSFVPSMKTYIELFC
ncbi:NUDIX domain-containing protein [Candidatus Woesearchaeota archaeon]|nr:NUDIX domain-containing protein [Candidatus Woesearchaeota archaeon]